MSDETVREDRNATVRENQNATVREGSSATGTGGVGAGSTCQGYRVVRQLPAKGSEADIFVVEKNGTQYILKQYRYGINPKRDILLTIKALSESHPHEFVRLVDADFNPASGRWYEIQEYVPNGSLQSLMADRSLLTGAQRATFFNDVARELADDLHALHENNLLHLDLKPSNILLRSVHPLNLVLIDFGIATSLASDMSKKFTQVRGTPMYQSPESYSGGMGRSADWWGLGMILLEIVAGMHPFRGVENSVIIEWVLTKPAPIPENLEAGQKELLRGLLTRDPEKRWGYEQVARWLAGERGILQYFETAPSAQTQSEKGSLTPITFMEVPYRNLAELAAAFLKDELAWEKGKALLMRGYVRQWLKSNKDFETIVSIDDDEVLSNTKDPDEKLFRFTQRFGGDMPFAFGGHLITIENLLIFTGKVLKRQPVTEIEQKIVASIKDGVLLSCLDFYKQRGQTSGMLQELGLVLESLKGKPQEDIAGFLDFYLHPKNYYCPSLKGNTTIGNIAKYVSSSSNVPITVEERKKMEQERREQERKKQQERRKQERIDQHKREQDRQALDQQRKEETTEQQIKEKIEKGKIISSEEWDKINGRKYKEDTGTENVKLQKRKEHARCGQERREQKREQELNLKELMVIRKVYGYITGYISVEEWKTIRRKYGDRSLEEWGKILKEETLIKIDKRKQEEKRENIRLGCVCGCLIVIILALWFLIH
ncbi:MAG: protein kinase [Deltaproteobacteria bacterium]|nr:protein kinase [Deltaproteobacteria bacterium]